ncbi:hypothetical protein DRQ36_09420 [bacterium]|nr:MAG: hypothetical protein DRQ36_09420 [bacterium]
MLRINTILFLFLLAAGGFADMAVTTATQDQTAPSAAGMANRTFVAWTDARAGTGNKNIYGNIIDTDGTLIGTDIPLCVDGAQQYDVGTTDGAKFVAAWVDERSGNPEIYARQINNDGTTPIAEFQVTSTTNTKSHTKASNVGNDILIVFEEAGTVRKIRGHRLSWGTQYNATGSTFDISGNYDAWTPDVAGGSTDFLVVWVDTLMGAVIGQRVNTSGTLVGDTTYLATYSYPYYPQRPAVAWDGSQWFVVWHVFVSTSMNVYGRYVNSSGVATGLIYDIATGSQNCSYPDVDFDGIGYLIGWQDTRTVYANIWGRRLKGTTLDAEEAISTGDFNENFPTIAWNGSYFDVCWQDYRGTFNWDIYTNRMDATPWDGPTATPIRPTDMGASSCIRQEAVLYLYDSDGINTSTIEFDANGTIYDITDPELTYSDDTLEFNPSADWPEGVWITCCLNHAEDMGGLDILSPVCWDFMVDRTDPFWGVADPADGDTAGSGAIPVSIEADDAGCGISTDSMGFQVEGSWYFYGASAAVSWDGTEMHFDPGAEGISFEPDSHYTVCATVGDNAEYCAPNQIDTCWTFYTKGNKIYGYVTLSGESDHSGASVEAAWGDSLWSDITDIAGYYSIPGVMAVSGITVTASKAGFSDSSVTVDMSAGGNHREDFTLNPTLAIYESDFESDNGGLDTIRFPPSYPNDWRWGTPTDGPSGAHSGTKCWGTILDGDYHNQSKSRLVLGKIFLPLDSAPTLSWWQWYRFQPGNASGYHDGGNLKLWLSSTDSAFLIPDRVYDEEMSQWNRLIAYQDAYADDDRGVYWHEVSVDLTPWEGDSVYISWDFGSSGSNVESGWFIDDVSIVVAPPNVLGFEINCTTWTVTALARGDTIISAEPEKIVITNTGDVPIDMALQCDTIDYFTLKDSLCYGCLGLWGIFNDLATPPAVGDFDTDDFISYVLRYSDSDSFGPGGNDIFPHIDSTENLWFRLDTPASYPIDTFTIRVLLQAREHIE